MYASPCKARPFLTFDLTLLSERLEYVEGKRRTPISAREIATEVLFSQVKEPRSREYLQLCNRAGVGSDSLVTKCDRIITALTYVKLEKES